MGTRRHDISLGIGLRRPAVALTFRGIMWASLLAIPGGFGCRPAGPPRYDITGTVSYEGKPVPAGTITFIPVGESAAERGPGFCQFTNGRYASRSGRSPGSGPYRFVIDGFDGAPSRTVDGDESLERPLGKPIFDTQVVEIELPPRHGGAFDINLPHDTIR